MKKRSEEILRLLVKNQKKISIHSLKKKYQVSERTIRNDLTEINTFLRKLHVSDIYFDVDGDLKTGPDFNPLFIEEELVKINTYSYKLNPHERQIYIILLLLWNHNYIVMKQIAERLYVSRLTILNDFDVIKERLAKKQVKVISDAGKGVYMRCSKEKRIELLVEILKQLTLEVENEGFFQRFVLEQLQIRYTFNEICSYAQEYMNSNNLVFIADTLYETVLYLFVVFHLSAPDEPTKASSNVLPKDELLCYVATKLGCSISNEMIAEFENYMSEHELSLYVRNLDQIELYQILIHFISRIDYALQLNLCQDSLLIDSLLLHIKNMRDWGDLEFEFSALHEVVFDYELLLATVNEHIYILEKYLSYKINDNMKKSIMLHICVSIIRNNEKAEKPSVIIVCPGSMATGRYLEAQIKNYFDFNIKGLYSVSDITKKLEHLENIDFIIATVQLPHLGHRCLKVHAVLTMQDMNLIQKTASRYFKPQTAAQANKKDEYQMLLQNKDIPGHLYEKIESLISEYRNEEKKERKTAIGELLKPNQIIFEEGEQDWEQCIRKSAVVLIEKNSIGAGFVEKAIQNIKDYGDYIILGNGVALAHAGKEYEVYQEDLSLLVSHEGIVFTESKRKVEFLFCFSSKGEKDHLQLFHEIIRIGQDEAYKKELLQMNQSELYLTLCFEK